MSAYRVSLLSLALAVGLAACGSDDSTDPINGTGPDPTDTAADVDNDSAVDVVEDASGDGLEAEVADPDATEDASVDTAEDADTTPNSDTEPDVAFDVDADTAAADAVEDTASGPRGFGPNPTLSGTENGMLNVALVNRNPDCRVYATDGNGGDYGAIGADDASNAAVAAPWFPGTNVESVVNIDLVIVSGEYIQDPGNPNIAGGWDYETVVETADHELATHCRMTHNMIPNHDFGWEAGPRSDPDVWVTEIDHGDLQRTYIPVNPVMSEPRVADDTDRNPTNFMDYDGILLNGCGIAMDSGFCYNPESRVANVAGNATGCGGLSVWYEVPAYGYHDHTSENMSAIFDAFWGHGFEGSYHYHAVTHPLQADDELTNMPLDGSPLIGFAKDGFPIYGGTFVNAEGELVRAVPSYRLRDYELNDGNSRDPYTDLPPAFLRGTPPTPWDILNRPEDFDTDFGVPLGRYLDDWVYDGEVGNLDECNGATDINGVYGYYVTDTYPFGPICTFGEHEPSMGKTPPYRWDDETDENTLDENGDLINGH